MSGPAIARASRRRAGAPTERLSRNRPNDEFSAHLDVSAPPTPAHQVRVGPSHGMKQSGDGAVAVSNSVSRISVLGGMPADARRAIRRCDQPSSMLRPAQEGREARPRVETWPTKPV